MLIRKMTKWPFCFADGSYEISNEGETGTDRTSEEILRSTDTGYQCSCRHRAVSQRGRYGCTVWFLCRSSIATPLKSGVSTGPYLGRVCTCLVEAGISTWVVAS